MGSRPFTRRKDVGQSTSVGKNEELCLRRAYCVETGFSSEDLRLSHGGKRVILFLKILFRVEFCFVLLSAFLFLESGFLCIVLAILELTL